MKFLYTFTVILHLAISSNISFSSAVKLSHNHHFGAWTIYEGTKNGKKLCHAVAEPFKTRAFHGIRNKPWVAINFMGLDRFTVSADSGFNIDISKGWIIAIDNGHSIALKVLPSGEIWSYSSTQDVQLINELMQGKNLFTVRSYNHEKQTALDYYSLKGLHKAIKYMNKYCLS